MLMESSRVPEYANAAAPHWATLAPHSRRRLSKTASKLWLYLTNDLPGPGPARLNGHPAEDWMHDSGVSSRGAFFASIAELEAHAVIARDGYDGINIEVLQPPNHMPDSVFAYEITVLHGKAERLQQRLQALERERAEYQLFLCNAESAASPIATVDVDFQVMPEIGNGENVALPAPTTADAEQEAMAETAVIMSTTGETVTEHESAPIVSAVVDEPNQETPEDLDAYRKRLAEASVGFTSSLSRIWGAAAADLANQGLLAESKKAHGRSKDGHR